MISSDTAPIASYRLQFNRGFTFSDALGIVDYLHRLGIGHLYASPYLKARPGSPHGYDIVDHEALNPEIGDPEKCAALAAALRARGMGQILDVVPNHMAVGGRDNAWWQDVLEHGEASLYAGYFDIDWRPADPELHGRVLLPFLGAHYGRVLEQGELEPVFDERSGSLCIAYYGHRFPLDPATWPAALAPALSRLAGAHGSNTCAGRTEASAGARSDAHAGLALLSAVLAACAALPRRGHVAPAERARRRSDAAAVKRRLAAVCRQCPAAAAALHESLAVLRGRIGDPASFDRLHELLERQAWRLAFWQVATDQINYRRFFDINELAGLRTECEAVFRDTHRLVARLLDAGIIDGLRIDHPDGLADPQRYFERLQSLADRPLYVVAEKILAGWEHLPPQWPIAGTTGYDFAGTLNGLFVWPHSERRLNRLYRRFTGQGTHFDELLYERKKHIIRGILSAELTVLGNLLYRIAQDDRRTRDFTRHGLLDAITETVACFPVYRSYVTVAGASEEDRRYVRWAITRAARRRPGAGGEHGGDPGNDLYGFLHDALLLEPAPRLSPAAQAERIEFTRRFQQYTAPVMAKGMEDTSFYIHNRLASLNDVGFDPRLWSVSTAAFHHQNRQRLSEWPDAMICTSTHDSKRGEDTRARIDVISEIPDAWQCHLSRWSRINRTRKRLVDGKPAPARNDEYLLYQTLFGIWPLMPPAEADFEALRERLERHVIKAAREAKRHTSWIAPEEEYEAALRHFVAALLHDPGRNPFLADFMPFVGEHVSHGLLNGLSQTLLRLTAPGVPDTYQGCELWCCTLVDPDNRRPVDYALRRRLLDEVETLLAARGPAACAGELLCALPDGRIKLYVTWRTLRTRQARAALYRRGDYLPLDARGERADHVCAFARRCPDAGGNGFGCGNGSGASTDLGTAVSVAARWFARLAGYCPGPPLGPVVWKDTWLEMPHGGLWREVYSGRNHPTELRDGVPMLPLAAVFEILPVALLLADRPGS